MANSSLVTDVTKDLDSAVHVVFEEEDVPFEEEILRNPHSLKAWLRYIDSREDTPASKLNVLYERSLKELPGKKSFSTINIFIIMCTYFHISISCRNYLTFNQ
jgi:hypothetical protein